MAESKIAPNTTRRDALTLTGTGILAALGCTAASEAKADEGDYAIERVTRLMEGLSLALADYEQECEQAGGRATCTEAHVWPARSGQPVSALVNPRTLQLAPVETSVNPELARLIAVETEAKAAYDVVRVPFDHAERVRMEGDGSISDAEWQRIEQAEADHVNAWADTQEDVLAFPAIERCDVIAKANWLADRYPRQHDFLPTDAAALWTAFFTIANTTA